MRHRNTDPQQLEAEIVRLGDLSRSELVVRWRALFGAEAPKPLGRELLVRGIAHQLQERAFGGLDRCTARMLDQIARTESSEVAARMAESPRLKPGTLLVREWQGQLHRVMVLDEGFAWNGGTYASPSGIARVITGTRWNGPLFFGLRHRPEEPASVVAAREAQAPRLPRQVRSGADRRHATPARQSRLRRHVR